MSVNCPKELKNWRCRNPYWNARYNVMCPCGKCVYCRKQKAKNWKMRLAFECEDWKNILFVTLTYKEYDPLVEGFEFEKSRSLCYSDVQYWLKRIRKDFAERGFKVRFYAAGEYGDNFTQRSHWHVLIFNCDYTLDNVRLIEDKWPYGRVDVRPVVQAAFNNSFDRVCAYISQYVVKKVGMSPDEYRAKYNRTPPLQHCSQGIGKKAFLRIMKKACIEQLKKCNTYNGVVYKGKVIWLDRYLQKKLSEELGEGIPEYLKSEGLASMRNYLQESIVIFEKFGYNYPEKYKKGVFKREYLSEVWKFRHEDLNRLKESELKLKSKKRGDFQDETFKVQFNAYA